MKLNNLLLAFLFLLVILSPVKAQQEQLTSVREKILMDFNWRFALGHSYDIKKDFNHSSSYFSYFAKTGYGDGAAAKDFDDRAWRILDLPHDWCVELPFDKQGGFSHGYKAIGKNFPQNSVGWYRKKFIIPESDFGKRIILEFDGVFRNSRVWVNGFYLGNEQSGYLGFSYDISDYLSYGGENVIAVRVDATMEEGWFYEGAGIYRHVWLTKLFPLHVAKDGTFITSDLVDNSAIIKVRTNVFNELKENTIFSLEETIVDSSGNDIASSLVNNLTINSLNQKEIFTQFKIDNPKLWSIGSPYLHKLKTVIRSGEKIVDTYETIFGIRTVYFDPDKGFFLNGKPVKILGTNNHQDHAGVGIAVPDALQEFRIKRLKDMGSNAIRTSHNPPTPELLDACDKLGMLVIDENRLMGVNKEHLTNLERLIKRDHNHPSVILWSLGNEEWSIEGNELGARIAATMQNFAQQLDSSRAFTVAVSGGWDNGIGKVIQVMGYNYIVQGNIDEHHKKFPWQAGIGTEESNTIGTRGIYISNDSLGHIIATNRMPENVGTESGWKFYSERPFLAGVFYWTGFDYRGEMIPCDWPAVSSQYGILDLCGFPKDIFYYLKSWWSDETVLHLTPVWNWKNHSEKEIPVTVYSNCEEVELFINNKSLGKKKMPVNGHLEWLINYQRGILIAHGYKDGKLILEKKIRPFESADKIILNADRSIINADGEDVSLISVQVSDSNDNLVTDDNSTIYFKLQGPGKIIGVGNGDPSSHEPDRYFETVTTAKIENLKELAVDNLENRSEISVGFDDSNWSDAFRYNRNDDWQVYKDSLIVIRGSFELPDFNSETKFNLFTKSIVENQSIYINGNLIARNIKRDEKNQSFLIDHKIIKPGKNDFAVTGQRFRKKHQWDEPNTDPGLLQIIIPAELWKRKLFNGMAQVIVQSTKQPGEILLTATGDSLKKRTIKIQSKLSNYRSAIE